ncbi:MAG: hypothetical protein HQL96_06660 [Magnetococcales bacterium]|nr:hypothetical protein [Magnetococcales bacterium]
MNHPSQGAATLLTSLVILIVLTLLVVTSLNVSTVQLRIIGNTQTVKNMDAASQRALEFFISSSANFSVDTPSQSFTEGADTGTLAAPQCIHSQVATGSSAVWSMAPRDNVWELQATITNSATGAKSTIHQGIQVRQLVGSCCPTCVPQL